MTRRTMRLLTCGALVFILSAGSARSVLAGSACPAAPVELAAGAQSASDAFASMNGSGFDAARAALTKQLTCLSSPPDARQAAMVHLVEALAAFRAKNQEDTRTSLHAMFESDPSLVLGEALAPKGAPLDRRATEARALPPSPRVPHNLGMSVIVDGRPSPSLPTTRPALVVVVDELGRVRWSGLLPAGASIPVQPVQATAESQTSSGETTTLISDLPPQPPDRGAQAKRARPLLIAAGGSALATGVLGALYVPAYRRVITVGELIETEAPPEEWDESIGGYRETPKEVYPLHERALALGVATVAAAGVTVGLGTVGLVIRW